MNRQDRQRLINRYRLLAVICGVLMLVALLDTQLRPLIKSYSSNQAKRMVTQAVNDAVTNVLSEENVKYEDLVTLGKNEAGDIVSIETNIVKINSLKAAVTTAILKELAKYQHLSISIPLGTLIGGDLFTGRGPKIPLEINISANTVTTMHSNFSSAGINQTDHQIVMDITSTVFSAVPGYNSSTVVETCFAIAETVLVGEVPTSFTDVEGDNSDVIGKIFDYSDRG
jgi:sporulation protein YunB